MRDTNPILFFIKQSWLLLVSAFLFGLLIAVTNAALKDKIEGNATKKINDSMKTLITDGETFEKIISEYEISLSESKTVKADIYKASDKDSNLAGFAFVAIGTGFQDKIKLLIATDAEFKKLKGYEVLSSNETPGFGDKIKQNFYKEQFVNAPVKELELVKSGNATTIDDSIVSITGATITSTAVVDIFNNYMTQIKEALIEKGEING